MQFSYQSPQLPQLPPPYPELSLPEVREIIHSLQAFLASPAYAHFQKTFQAAQNETTLVVTTVKPADLSQFLLREQGFGQLTEILKIKTWFTDTLSEFEATASYKEKQHQNQN